MGRGIGLSLPNRGILFGATTVEELYALTDQAERSGAFDSVWVGDGLIAKPRLESIVSLSALAARTSSLRVGVCCMATFPLRNPVLFASQWASLDVISQGRSLLAVCLGAPTGRGGGNFDAELEAMGVEARDRVSRMEEAIDLIRRLWAGPTAHDGRFWRFPEIDLQPKPLQDPCPVWIASNPDPRKLSPGAYARAIARVGRLADGWMSTVVGPEDFGGRWQEIRRAAREAGRDPDRMTSSAHLMVNLQDDREKAWTDAKRFLDSYYTTDVRPETMEAWGAYGHPRDVADRIEMYLESGMNLPILRFASYDQMGQLARALDELLPRITR